MLKKWGKKYWVDVGERVGTTFLEVLIPMYVTVENVAVLDWRHALAVSGSAAGLSFLKNVLSNLKKDLPTASLVNVTSQTVS